MQSCEIKVVRRGDLAAISHLTVMPTVCLVAFQNPAASSEIDLLAKASLAVGTESFALYGPHADALEDDIDFVLEQGEPSWLNISTTSHQGESPQDVAQFVLHAAHPGDEPFRCLLVLDDQLAAAEALMYELV
ncbi:hypothetical protein [Pseudoduganella aquatica]|uniref:Uncharacterized protein n=1 Tax=Pseudoduganella aquatica TaxID=2660641 RepID=A0A7X4HE33_9BURK|nr:hypothetical protein [Pseudoduganella aquatica]MYN09068.1 hypothetical protein [Pseudoduganella aquatica]